jgi:hypothetical protein
MSDLKIAVGGLDYFPEQSTAANGTTTMTAVTTTSTNNIMTITTAAAHGLTFNPAANVLPNYFVKFGGTGYSAISGTGVLLNNVFRILSIPSTTTFTIYTTITSITTTTGSLIIPVFYPVFQTALLSGAATGTLASGTTGAFATSGGYPFYGSTQCVNFTFGANCNAQYNPDNTGVPLDASTGNTPSTAPTVRTLAAVSTSGQLRFGPYDYIQALGSAATSVISIVQ